MSKLTRGLRAQITFAADVIFSMRQQLSSRYGPLRNPWKDPYPSKLRREIDYVRHSLRGLYRSLSDDNPKLKQLDKSAMRLNNFDKLVIAIVSFIAGIALASVFLAITT